MSVISPVHNKSGCMLNSSNKYNQYWAVGLLTASSFCFEDKPDTTKGNKENTFFSAGVNILENIPQNDHICSDSGGVQVHLKLFMVIKYDINVNYSLLFFKSHSFTLNIFMHIQPLSSFSHSALGRLIKWLNASLIPPAKALLFVVTCRFRMIGCWICAMTVCHLESNRPCYFILRLFLLLQQYLILWPSSKSIYLKIYSRDNSRMFLLLFCFFFIMEDSYKES